jgi:neopullulanase
MKKIIYTIFILIVLVLNHGFSQDVRLENVEPPNWWTNMKANKIQLMLYGNDLNYIQASFNTDKIKINKIHDLDNDSCAFVDIEILDDCLPGDYVLTVKNDDSQSEISFPVYERNIDKNRHLGFDSKDIIYLITPDRFVNGDESNDNISGMRDNTDRSDILRRHGGDIQGIIDNLDYIKDLGFTTIWINPLLENDMDISYHGYAATDLYKIDPRFGTNALYKELVDKSHSLGLKMILDHVSNHVGMYHSWVSNPPTEDWFHGTMENHLYARHDKSVLVDKYADSSLIKNMKEGWFVTEMPDLNQSNIYLNNYLIQNTIWWIESFGIDGIREDTYPYVDQQFLSDWAKAIFEEYPNFNIVGEIWINDPAFLAPFQKNSSVAIDIDTHLPSVTDFGLMESFGKVLHHGESIYNVYQCLSKDYLYNDPNMLVTFLDNHDVMRVWDLVDGDIRKYKMALVMLFTLRGIPQIYYGTEVGLPGGDDHGLIRRDMPGGFSRNSHRLSALNDLTDQQKSIYNFIKKLIKIRNENNAITLGSLIHFPPENEIYSYVRKFNDEMILILCNNGASKKQINLSEISHFWKRGFIVENLINGKTLKIEKKQYVELDKYGFSILKIVQK